MNSKINKCRADTHEHVREVGKNINVIIKELLNRIDNHDNSKFESPELEIFANAKLLKHIKYGSEEYNKNLEQIRPAIDHHFSKNRHHPEFHKNGINGMDLIDLIELLSDWFAATKRNSNGNIRKSIDINAKKYEISPQLKEILENTIDRYF